MIRFVLLVVLLVAATATGTTVRKCSKGQPFPLSVNIEGCSTMPCNVIKGSVAVMDVHFVGTHDGIEALSAEVKATTMGITVSYDLPEEIANVCKNLKDGASCPVDQGEDATYAFKFPVESYYPEISVQVEVSLVDNSSKDTVACFAVDIKVKKH